MRKTITTLLVLVALIMCSCQEENIELSPDCYKLDHPEVYLEGLPTGNTTVWAITTTGEEVEIACSWADAFTYKYQYNCNNYPSLFGDVYVLLRSKGIPCQQ
jgi:hypothetical protein